MTDQYLVLLEAVLWVIWIIWSFCEGVGLAVWLVDEKAHIEKLWKLILWVVVSVIWLWYQCNKVSA